MNICNAVYTDKEKEAVLVSEIISVPVSKRADGGKSKKRKRKNCFVKFLHQLSDVVFNKSCFLIKKPRKVKPKDIFPKYFYEQKIYGSITDAKYKHFCDFSYELADILDECSDFFDQIIK